MRMLIRARLETHAANDAIRSGKLQKVMGSVLERLNPEAVYYTTTEGGRSCIVVFDMADSSQMPVIAEPLFQELGAEVEFSPVMNREELQQGLAAAQQKG